jgi:hypothetical protein
MWLPNLILGGVGVVFFFYTVKDRSMEKLILPFNLLRSGRKNENTR